MKKDKTVHKIGLILLLIILLPALAYTVYEFTSLNRNEKLISEIYDQQLETILFSVNQYSWDVTNSWVSRISLLYEEGGGHPDRQACRTFLESQPAIGALVFSPGDSRTPEVLISSHTDLKQDSLLYLLRRALGKKQALVPKLDRYKKAGYRKIQPVLLNDSGDPGRELFTLLFVLNEQADSTRPFIAGMILNPGTFIREVLWPKFGDLAAGRFNIATFYNDIPYPPPAFGPETARKITQRHALWLFPRYFLGIRLASGTIEDIARERFHINLIFIGILDVVLLFAGWVLYRSIRREVQLARMKSDFVSNVSHELRTPLSLIRMFAETLEMGRLRTEEKKKQYYHIISQETERLTRLVNNILNFSRMEAGRKQYHFEINNLNRVVEEVLDIYSFHLQNEGFEFSLDLDKTLTGISMDSEAVSEALINLLDNSIKYSQTEKFIAVRTGMRDGRAFLEVEDHGIGIPPREREHIFDKFYRISNGLVHNTRGSGLGLTLVRHIMDAHHGNIELQSTEGKGSRFRLLFNPGRWN